MTQSGMMFALAGPMPRVTLGLVPVMTKALFSVQRVTLVPIVRDSDRPSRQNTSFQNDNSCQSGTGPMPLSNVYFGLFCKLYFPRPNAFPTGDWALVEPTAYNVHAYSYG
jgi:hypothetical protein